LIFKDLKFPAKYSPAFLHYNFSSLYGVNIDSLLIKRFARDKKSAVKESPCNMLQHFNEYALPAND